MKKSSMVVFRNRRDIEASGAQYISKHSASTFSGYKDLVWARGINNRALKGRQYYRPMETPVYSPGFESLNALINVHDVDSCNETYRCALPFSTTSGFPT